jgi:signal transduction histidine kinase
LARDRVGLDQGESGVGRQKPAPRGPGGWQTAALITHPDPLLVVSPGLKIRLANPPAERLFGHPVGGLIGRGMDLLVPAATGRRLGVGCDEVIGRRADGSIRPLELRVARMPGGGGFVVVVRDTEHRPPAEAALDVAAAERRRVWQDLHDDIGQELVALRLMAAALVEGSRKQESLDDGLGVKVRDGVQRVLERVRAAARGLTASGLGAADLAPALEALAGRTRESAGVACTFRELGDTRIPEGPTAPHLYRIAQEAVTNALKHAAPTAITITLVAEDGKTELRVRDNGRGFDPAAVPGLGLESMRSRAGLLGATLSLEPENPGTLVRCTL